MNNEHQISNAQRKLVRLGFASKGFIYVLIGVLAILPIIGMGQGGGSGGQKHAIIWLMEQPFGIVLVALVALGLLFYAFWRITRAFSNNPRYEGLKGVVKRIGMGISGVLYGGFAFYAGYLVFQAINGGGGSSSGNQKMEAIQMLMEKSWGRILLIIIGVILIGRSIYYVYIAVTGKYKERVQGYGLEEKYADYLIKSGMLGFIARGIVFTIIGFFVIRAVIQHDPDSASNGIGEAFQFLQSTGGNILLIVIALGFICYGIFMFMQAKYRNVESIF